MCAPIKLNFPFCKRKPLFDALSNVYQTDLSDVFVVTVIARNRINGVGSLFFRDRILRFGKNMSQSLKKFLNNFNFNSAHAPLNRDEGGLLPDDYLHLVRKKKTKN